MAYTQSDLDKLDLLMLGGVQEVTFADGRKIRNQALADLLKLRDAIRSDIATVSARARLRTTVGRIVR